MNMFSKVFGSRSQREVKRIMPLVDKIESLRPEMQKLSDEELKGKTREFKKRLEEGETLDDLLPEAFAVVREAGKRVLGMEHFRVQLIGGIILGYIWQLLLNGVLAHWGKTLTYSGTYGLMGMIILVCWQQIGYMMIIYISGIQNIPGELIEAAKIDGANSWQVLRKVIIPMVMPSITICTFLTLTNGFKLFDQNLALTNGAPSKMSELLALNIFNTFYGRAGYEGVGQAKAVIFFLIVGLVAVIQNRMTRSKEVQQ